jgi:hypothetical protein
MRAYVALNPAVLSARISFSGAVPFGRRSCPAERQELGPQISCRLFLMDVAERLLGSHKLNSCPRA